MLGVISSINHTNKYKFFSQLSILLNLPLIIGKAIQYYKFQLNWKEKNDETINHEIFNKSHRHDKKVKFYNHDK